MPNFAIALKEEIRRLARREIKQATGTTKRAIVQCRKEIAKLRRQLSEQHKTRSSSGNGYAADSDSEADDQTQGLRFSTRSVRAQRRRLGLSAEDYAKLIGVSALTVYNWEHGRTRPRDAQFLQLASIRGIGKREAQERLAAVGEEAPTRKPR